MKFTIKDLLKSLGIGLIIFLMVILINFIYGAKIAFDSGLGKMFLYTMLYSVVLGFANRAVFIYLDKLFAKERFSLKRMIVGFSSSFVVTLLIIFLLRILQDVVIEGGTFEKYWANERLANYVFASAMSFIILLCFYAFYIYKAYSDSKVKEQKIIAVPAIITGGNVEPRWSCSGARTRSFAAR